MRLLPIKIFHPFNHQETSRSKKICNFLTRLFFSILNLIASPITCCLKYRNIKTTKDSTTVQIASKEIFKEKSTSPDKSVKLLQEEQQALEKQKALEEQQVLEEQKALEEQQVLEKQKALEEEQALKEKQALEEQKNIKPVIVQSSYSKNDKFYMDFNKEIFKETVEAYTNGYLDPKGKNIEFASRELQATHIVKIDNEPMLKETRGFENLAPLPPAQQIYPTQFSVMTEDTFQVLIKLKREGVRPVGINMANAYFPGGGVKEGCTAQEEALCRRSNHLLGLETQKYPLPEFGGIYCPHVQVFRDTDFKFFDQPVEVDLVAIASYDLREKSSDRTLLGLPLEGPLGDLANCQSYVQGMEKKICNMLRQMNGHTHLVLGALGCGAFDNPPELVAAIFRKVLSSDEFKGRFQSVIFAILQITAKDQHNVTAFRKICEELNNMKANA